MKRWTTGALCALLLPAVTEAQAPLPGRLEVAAGGLWAAAVSAGTADATETAANGTRFRLFVSDSSLGSAFGVEGRVGIRLTGLLQLEGSTSYAAPELRTRVRADIEGAPDATLVERLRQVTIEAALVAHLARWRFRERNVPFVSAGVGYLQQLHEGDRLEESGAIYQVGGGVNTLLKRSDGGRLKSVGLRVGARAVIHPSGLVFNDEVRVSPRIDASLFARF